MVAERISQMLASFLKLGWLLCLQADRAPAAFDAHQATNVAEPGRHATGVRLKSYVNTS